ncbi:MAG: XylR family transcriptional regulator [Planctomycetaceae bacterium]
MKKSQRIVLVFDCDLAYPRGVLRGIKQFAQTKPHWVLVLHESTGATRSVLKSIRCDALIANVSHEGLLTVLKSLHKPVVNVSPVLPQANFPRVMVNHRQIGELAFHHLHDCGLRHFAFVGHPRHLYSTEREAGFREALGRFPYSYARYYERPTTSYRHRAHLLALQPAFQRWLRSLPRPVGVFACHDVWGVQLLNACQLTGLRIPDEVAVVGVDNDDLLCELARPSLSSIIVPAEQVGYEAAKLLESLLQRDVKPKSAHLIPAGGVVVRQSSDILAGGDPDVTAAVRMIRDRGMTCQQVTDVLNRIPASRRSLEKRFHATLKRGIGAEIRRVRLERARDLLANTALSIADVAEQAGYSSMHYLARSFRRETGQTPSEFRAQFRARIQTSLTDQTVGK